MKITFDIDVERKKSVVNFEFAENEDSFAVCKCKKKH